MSTTRRNLIGFVATSMAFGLFKRKEKQLGAPTATRSPPPPTAISNQRVVVEGIANAPVLPTPPTPAPTDPMQHLIKFQGLHRDFNPSASVKTGQMTCPSCQASFRMFLNSDGKKTIVKCPSCAKQYKV